MVLGQSQNVDALATALEKAFKDRALRIGLVNDAKVNASQFSCIRFSLDLVLLYTSVLGFQTNPNPTHWVRP